MLAWSSCFLRIIRSSRESSMPCWWRTSSRRGACNSSQIWGSASNGTAIAISFRSWAGWRHMIRFAFSKVRNQIFWESIFSKHSLVQHKKLVEEEGDQWASSSSRIRYNFWITRARLCPVTFMSSWLEAMKTIILMDKLLNWPIRVLYRRSKSSNLSPVKK